MYKNIIIVISLIFMFAGAQYINKAGSGMISDIIQKKMTPEIVHSITIQIESIPGVYVCDINSGCTTKYTLLLKTDKTAEIIPEIAIPEDERAPAISSNLEIAGATTLEHGVIDSTIVSTSTETIISNELLSTSTETIAPNSTASSTDGNTPIETTAPTSTETVSSQKINVASEETAKNINTLTDNLLAIIEKGNWDLGVQNMLIITIKEYGTSTYEIPQKIVVQNVQPTILSKISYTKSIYKDMINPVFIKQD